MLAIIHCIWRVCFLILQGVSRENGVKIFKEDVLGYPISIGKENKFQCVVIGSRVWPCKYRVDSLAIDKAVYDKRICG